MTRAPQIWADLAGHTACSRDDMRHFTELVAWQLCHQLKCEVFAFTDQGPGARDFRYRDDIRAASASAAANIAEGFGRYRPREFARFLEYAVASLVETENHLLDGHDRSYLDEQLYSRLRSLTQSATRTTKQLLLAKRRQIAAVEQGRRAPTRRRRRRPKTP